MPVTRVIASIFLISSAVLAACGGDVSGGGGSDGGCPPVPIHCSSSGCGASVPLCQDGQWVCASPPGPSCLVDASAVDASADADAASDAPVDVAIRFDAASIACGPVLVCANDAQFCEEASGGPPPPPDSGSGVGYGCQTFPAACANDHSCACLRANGTCGGGLVDCRTTGAGITVSCAFP